MERAVDVEVMDLGTVASTTTGNGTGVPAYYRPLRVTDAISNMNANTNPFGSLRDTVASAAGMA